jgi:hypothetical protein
MKYSEHLVHIESISLTSPNESVSQSDYICAVNKATLKVLLKSSSELLNSSKKKIKDSTLNSEENIEKLHEDLSELRSMYNSLCTVLLTSCAFYMNIKKDIDGNEFQVYNDHWELIPTISNVLCTLLMDVTYNKEFILYNDPFSESEKEAVYKTYIMKLLTWGLNTRVFMEHPERMEGYESKAWGEPMTDEEREEIWNMNWKKTVKKETKSLFDVMNEQKHEVEIQKQTETKKRKEEELRTTRRSKWSDELDWRNFRK